MVSILMRIENNNGRNFKPYWIFSQDKRTNKIILKRGDNIISIINADHEFSIDEAKYCIIKAIRNYGDTIYCDKRKSSHKRKHDTRR